MEMDITDADVIGHFLFLDVTTWYFVDFGK